MVRAILEGRKTQTRRVCKPAQAAALSFVVDCDDGKWGDEEGNVLFPCPYGQPGDRLWVRETFYCDDSTYPDGEPITCHWREVDGQRVAIPLEEQRAEMLENMYYRADGEPDWEGADGPTPWRPSIHMPRWASRITLEVAGVRVERLQDISEADARAESMHEFKLSPGSVFGYDRKGTPGPMMRETARAAFAALWELLNGAGSWDANSWVWVIEFKRLEMKHGRS